MIIYEIKDSILIDIDILSEPKLFNIYSDFFRKKETDTIIKISDMITNIFSTDFPRMAEFKEILTLNKPNQISIFLSNEKKINKLDILAVRYGEKHEFKLLEDELLDILPLNYDFYKLPRMGEIIKYLDFGGELVKYKNEYYIKSNNISYLEFLEKSDILTNYKIIIPNIKIMYDFEKDER